MTTKHITSLPTADLYTAWEMVGEQIKALEQSGADQVTKSVIKSLKNIQLYYLMEAHRRAAEEAA